MFLVAVLLVGILSGATASVVGFGIGSLMTPATGLLVDAARTPVYLWHTGPVLISLWVPILVATVGVLIGTIVGERLLLGLSPRLFGQIIGVAIGALGIWLLVMPHRLE